MKKQVVAGALFRLSALAVAALLASCAAVGPDFVKPQVAAPDNWSDWSSASPELARPKAVSAPKSTWWEAFNDPVLASLQEKVAAQNPDLQTAILNYAQARSQRTIATSQQLPDAKVVGGVVRQRQSEYAAGNRILDVIAPNNREVIADYLSDPFTQYQAGIDVSWEIDLWGRVRRSIEAADANVAVSAALLDEVRVAIESELALAYVDLRTTQRLIALTRSDIGSLKDRTELMTARERRGLINGLDLGRQRLELANLEAQLPSLLEQEARSKNRIGLLLGMRPGALQNELAAADTPKQAVLPEYGLGLPSEFAARRPDIRAAEARLHQTTASIGEAQAQLYPSIRIGARAGLDSYLSGSFTDWGSRYWSIGPTLDLPIFDGGRRRATVMLRQLDQQKAAIDFQRTVLAAWQEVDDAVTGYTAEQERQRRLAIKVKSSGEVYALALSREKAGLTDSLDVIDAQRSDLQARRDLVASQGRVQAQFVYIHRALGGGATATDTDAVEHKE